MSILSSPKTQPGWQQIWRVFCKKVTEENMRKLDDISKTLHNRFIPKTESSWKNININHILIANSYHFAQIKFGRKLQSDLFAAFLLQVDFRQLHLIFFTQVQWVLSLQVDTTSLFWFFSPHVTPIFPPLPQHELLLPHTILFLIILPYTDHVVDRSSGTDFGIVFTIFSANVLSFIALVLA